MSWWNKSNDDYGCDDEAHRTNTAFFMSEIMKKRNVFCIKMYHCTPTHGQRSAHWKQEDSTAIVCVQWTARNNNENTRKKSYPLEWRVSHAAWTVVVFGCMTTTATVKTKPSIITTSQAISKQRNYGNYSIGRVSRCHFAHNASVARSVFYTNYLLFPMWRLRSFFLLQSSSQR